VGKILCATRGGEASYRTQDAAIELAKARGDTLIFLYVVGLDFLDCMAGAGVVDTEQELIKLGRFLLLMAKERAAGCDVEAEIVIREGGLREELKKAAREEQASLVVLGRPAEEGVFELPDLQVFAAEIESETGVETRVI
jgi:nucleotide-binding universal stress UspA family protein